MKNLLIFCSVLFLITIFSCSKSSAPAPYYPYNCNGLGATNGPHGSYLRDTVNGVVDSFVTATTTDSVYGLTNKLAHTIEIGSFDTAVTRYVDILFDTTNIAVNSQQPLLRLESSLINDSLAITTPIFIHITQYKDTGHIISGYFSGIFTGKPPASTAYTVKASFRTRLRAE